MFQINKQKLSYSSMTLLTSDVKKKFQNLQKYFSAEIVKTSRTWKRLPRANEEDL